MPVSLDEAYSSIANAVSDGTISEDRIDQSVKRILNAKNAQGGSSVDKISVIVIYSALKRADLLYSQFLASFLKQQKYEYTTLTKIYDYDIII